MTYSRIIGTGSYLPKQVLTNQDLTQRMETNDEWIRTRTGIEQRHVHDPAESTSDLALNAARKALEAAGVAASDLGLIVVATTTPDRIFPSTACILQAKLGASGCPAFDVQAVCAGFIYALSVADQFITSGKVKKALVVGAECFTNLLDWNDRGTAVLFGDGAGAVVLEASDQPGVLSTHLFADGNYADILSVPGQVCSGGVKGRGTVEMDGGAVFKFAVKVLEQSCREALDANGMTIDQVDWLIPHQANIRIMEATAQKLGIPREKVVVTVNLHANTSAASIPLALDLAVRDGRIKPGHRVLLTGVGGGFAWGSALIQM
jgi:3-oxoacyl-[acyl-carrier-protein] synthase-3